MKRLIYITLALSFIVLSLYVLGYILPSFISKEKIVNRSNCNDEEMSKNESIKGLVVKKIRDNYSHMWKTVEYSDLNGSHQTLIFRNDESKAYDFLVAGDSIVKEANSLELKILRDGNVKLYNLDYGCDSVNQ
jgi:hypothetical protein